MCVWKGCVLDIFLNGLWYIPVHLLQVLDVGAYLLFLSM